MTRIESRRRRRISQGDIYKDVDWIEHVQESGGILEVARITFPYVIVLTQDCDLEQDYKFRWKEPKKNSQDKYLISVLVAPIYNLEHVHNGEHLSELDLTMERISRSGSTGTNLRQNKNPRYHCLHFPSDIQLVDSVIDFKHYFSVHIEYLKSVRSSNFVCRVSKLFREDVSQRFASFLSRIGLPEPA